MGPGPPPYSGRSKRLPNRKPGGQVLDPFDKLRAGLSSTTTTPRREPGGCLVRANQVRALS